MALKCIPLCALLLVCTINASSSNAEELLSMCAVEGSQVEFHCPGAVEWHVGHTLYDDENDTLALIAEYDNGNSSTGGGEIFITCIIVVGVIDIDVSLIIVDESDTQVPLILTAAPETQTSLLLEWEAPFLIGNTTYEVVLSVGQEIKTWTTKESSLEVLLDGSECQPFQVSVSMPGTCTAATLNGSLLLDPPFPKPENVQTEVLKNKTLVLTWKQPENKFGEDNFTYVIMVFDGQRQVEERIVTLEASVSPREEFNLTQVEDCREVMVTLVQLGDCREEIVTTTVPIFPGAFLSELEAKVLFVQRGDLELVELHFKPPVLCEYQMELASYSLAIFDGARNWSVGPVDALSGEVVFSDSGEQFVRDKDYTVTATVFTKQGKVSSTTTFSTLSVLAEDHLDESSMGISVSNDSVSLAISWNNPTNTLSSYFAYVIDAVLVDTGESVGEQVIVVPKGGTPVVVLNMDHYICENVNISVQIFNSREIISKLITIPARPKAFQKNVTAHTFMVNGKIKELEVAFNPPRLCEFQRASYTMTFTSGNDTWSRSPVPISDTHREIKEDIENGFAVNINYTLTVTVAIVDYDNITSLDEFIFFHEEPPTDATNIQPSIYPTSLPNTHPTPPATKFMPPVIGSLEANRESMSSVGLGTLCAGVALLVVVIVSFVFGVGVCYLRARKKRRQAVFGDKTPRPNVTNPIYEAGDDVYEELPDLLRDKHGASKGATYCDVAPPLPSARYDHLPPALAATNAKHQDTKEEGVLFTKTPKHDPNETKKENNLTLPSSSSSGALSVRSSTEDCYTVMNPAGTVTVMPRSRASGVASQWGAPPAGE